MRLQIPWNYLTPKEIFRLRSVYLPQENSDAWFQLGQFCVEHELKAEAKLALKKALFRNNAHPKAKDLLAILEAEEAKEFAEESTDPENKLRPPKKKNPEKQNEASPKENPDQKTKKIETLNLFLTDEVTPPVPTSRPVQDPEVDSNLTSVKSDKLIGLYRLPFHYGSTYTCTVGNMEGYHKTYNTNAYDFRCMEGTPLYAIRGGTVSYLLETSTKGGPSIDFVEYSNEVWIEHNDGTTARYCHLIPYGVLVAKGETVVQGELIALSGNTGFSTGPHLHLEVKESRFETLKFEFADAGEPHKGTSCKSQNGPNISRKEKKWLMETLKEIRDLAIQNSFKEVSKLLKQLQFSFQATGYAEWLKREEDSLGLLVDQQLGFIRTLPSESAQKILKSFQEDLRGTPWFNRSQTTDSEHLKK